MEDKIRIICGIIYLIFVCCSFTINVLLLIVLIKGNKEFKKASFFILTWQLLIFDFMALTTHIFLAVPTTLAGFQFYSDFFNYFFSLFDKTAYYGTLLFAVILTLNRFMVFVFPQTNEKFFGHPEIFYTVAFGWALLAAFIVPLTLGGSYNYFDPVLFRLLNVKAEIKPWFALYITDPIGDGFSIFTPWIMIIIYVITFLEIKFGFFKRLRYGADPIITVPSSSSTTKKRGEIKILLQCFIICSIFQIEWFGFNYLPKLPKILPFLAPYVNTMTSIMTVCMNTVHSIVIFTFTSRARNILKNLFTKRSAATALPLNVIFIVQKKNSTATVIPLRRSV